MRARVVIGASFGDEGKGLITDYLCATQGAGVVVRFNGGSQAGHTVVMPEGQRHVFQHVGAGAFCGVPTFLSEYFVVNPLMFFKELDALRALGVQPMVFASPACPVTTFADMIINQRKEDARGAKRHGSVGLGIHETIQRNHVSELSITMADLWHGQPGRIKDKLREICAKWARFRSGAPIDDAEQMIEAFVGGCEKFAQLIHPAGIGQCEDPVFEGAQGLLLDQDRKEFWPHVTHSSTGMKNVRRLCQAAGIDQIDAYYVSRTYVTRHGAGALPGEDPKLSFEDSTNLEHAYQGALRFAPLDADAMRARCAVDFGSSDFNLVLTHFDQHPVTVPSALRSYGPTRADVERLS